MSRTHCSHCGASLRRDAPACPECGSDPETGWAPEEALGEAAFAPFDDEDYDEVVAGLPGHGEATDRSARDWALWAVAVLTLAAFLVAAVF